MVFSYYYRLDARRRRIYEASDAVLDLPLTFPEELRRRTKRLEESLASGHRTAVARDAQALVDAVCQDFRIPSVRVEVLERRPARGGSELHGLYEYGPSGHTSTRRRILVWMYTARLGKVVAFRTFLRTLVHEICHHLDVTLLHLPESLHTEGFYARESLLVRRLLGEEDIPPAARAGARRTPSPSRKE
jgi:hypothetical protein